MLPGRHPDYREVNRPAYAASCEVLSSLQRYDIRLKLSKCKLLQEKIEYLGHMVTREGLRPTEENMAALKKAATPTNVTELSSYLGLLKHYIQFLPDLSRLRAPLNALTHSCAEWSWDATCERAFKNSNDLICKAGIMYHYDPSKPLQLA